VEPDLTQIMHCRESANSLFRYQYRTHYSTKNFRNQFTSLSELLARRMSSPLQWKPKNNAIVNYGYFQAYEKPITCICLPAHLKGRRLPRQWTSPC